MWGISCLFRCQALPCYLVKLDILEILEEYEKPFPSLNHNLDNDVNTIYKPETITPEWQSMACLATVSQI